MRRFWTFVFLLFLLLLTFAPSVSAEWEAASDAYGELLQNIPRDVAERLPDGIFSEDLTVVGEAVREATGFERIMGVIGDILCSDLSGAVSLFGGLLGLLVLSALLHTVRGAVGSESLSRAVSLCGASAVTGCLLSLTMGAITMVSDFLYRLTAFVNGMIPVVGTLFAMGGNVGTAVVASGGLMMLLNLVENLCTVTLPPVVGMCVAVAVSGALFGSANLKGLSDFIKKTYTFFLGALMLVLTFTLSVQTSLAAGADGLAMKSARMIAGRAIPVVGGAVGETFRTLAAGIGYLKTTVGGVGIAVILLMLLPPLVTVLLYRWGLTAACAVADLLGCSAESRLLDAFVTVFGYMLAVLCICSVSVIFLLVLFVKCGVAMG